MLHILDSLDPEAGSAAVSLQGLPEALRARSVQSELIALNGHGTGVAVTQRLKQADVVHFHGWGRSDAARVASLARRHRTPYLISPYGALSDGPHSRDSFGDRLRSWFGGKRAIRRAAAVAALNEHERRLITSRGLHNKVMTLPAGIRVEDYTPKPTPTRGDDQTADQLRPGRLILIMGPIHPVEGLVLFLKAFAELGPAADGWNVALAGPEVDDWRKQLEAAVNRKGGQDRVWFTTAPDAARQRGLLGKASLLVVPSLQPRCPVSILQAVLMDVPVLATHHVVPEGLEEIVKVCAPVRGELRNALRAVLEMTDQQRADMARRARETAGPLLDWSARADQYADVYERVRA